MRNEGGAPLSRLTPHASLLAARVGTGLSHGYRHVGEIEYARGLIGLGGLTI